MIHSQNLARYIEAGAYSAYPDSVPFIFGGEPADFADRPRNTVEFSIEDAFRLFYRTRELIFTLEYEFRFEDPTPGEFNASYTFRLAEQIKVIRRDESETGNLLPAPDVQKIRQNVLGAQGWLAQPAFGGFLEYDNPDTEDVESLAVVFMGGFSASSPADQSSPGAFFRLPSGRTAFNGISVNVSGGGGFAYSSGPFPGQAEHEVGTANLFGTQIGLYSSGTLGPSRITTCNLTVEMGPDMPY